MSSRRGLSSGARRKYPAGFDPNAPMSATPCPLPSAVPEAPAAAAGEAPEAAAPAAKKVEAAPAKTPPPRKKDAAKGPAPRRRSGNRANPYIRRGDQVKTIAMSFTLTTERRQQFREYLARVDQTPSAALDEALQLLMQRASKATG